MKNIRYYIDENNKVIVTQTGQNELNIYEPNEVRLCRCRLDSCIQSTSTFEQTENKKIRTYSKLEIGFDIETSKVKEHEKSFMYVAQFSFGNKYCTDKFEMMFRKWPDVFTFLEEISLIAEENDLYLVIWIANMSYEMSFMLPWFEQDKLEIMADDKRRPLYVNYKHLQFRDTLRVSNMNLRNTARNYCTTQKTEMNYDTVRNSLTPLTDEELIYDFNDTRICCEYASFIISETVDKGLKLPFTQTGILRQAVKRAAKDDVTEFAKSVPKLFPKTIIEYQDIMEFLFAGGDTHARADLVGELIGNTPECTIQSEGVQCHDFESSYPARMAQDDNYPVSPFKRIYPDSIERRNKCFTYWYDVTIDGIQAKRIHTYISKHKCKFLSEKNVIDNGKIYYADRIRIYITEMDYECIKALYKWKKFKINRAFSALKGRLPEYLTDTVFHFGELKAKLKNEGKANTPEYCKAKAMYNAGYGLTVQKIHLDKIVYENKEWKSVPNNNYKDEIKQQILSPFWGIWITANARHELIKCMIGSENAGADSAYNDTDSLYLSNPSKAKEFVDVYNEEKRKLNKAFFRTEQLEYFKNLGTLDTDPVCSKFKTLGAKRYVKKYEDKKGIHYTATIAGLPKTSHNEYCEKKNLDFFDAFRPNEIVDEFTAHKLCSKYTDEEYTLKVTDYLGNTETMYEKSGVCLCEIGFEIYVKPEWLKWINSELKR